MSAKKSKPASPDLNFKHVGPVDLSDMPRSLADIVHLATNGASSAKLAAQRTLLIACQLKHVEVNHQEQMQPRRGRPKDLQLADAISEIRFDIDEFDALRRLGWGNVPSDKVVIGKAAERYQRKDNALNAAIKRWRKECS